MQQPGVLFLVFQDIDDYWFLHPRPPARRHPSGGQPLSQLQSVCANCAHTNPSLIGHQPVQWPLLSPQTPPPNKCHKYKYTTYTVSAKCVHVHWCCCFDVWRKESTRFMSSPTNKALECFCGAMTIRWPCAGMETRLNKVAPAAITRWRSGSTCYLYQHWIITINISPHARICRQVPGLQIKFVDLINLMSRPRQQQRSSAGPRRIDQPNLFPTLHITQLCWAVCALLPISIDRLDSMDAGVTLQCAILWWLPSSYLYNQFTALLSPSLLTNLWMQR